MDQKVIDAAKQAYPADESSITLGAVVHNGSAHPETIIGIPLSMVNRHGLIAGVVTRGLMGALLGTPPRRKRRGLF